MTTPDIKAFKMNELKLSMTTHSGGAEYFGASRRRHVESEIEFGGVGCNVTLAQRTIGNSFA
jgi:hypothetical protein